MDQHAAPAPPLFEAVIVPHRSLSRRGFQVLVALICASSAMIAVRFWLIGAWPVIGFTVVEVGLVVLLLLLHARRARASELLLLTEESLRLIRTDAAGRRQTRVISPTWLQVVLEERRGKVPALLLQSREAREEIGRVLGEEEKRDLAAALRSALYRARNPRFDNPQLRD